MDTKNHNALHSDLFELTLVQLYHRLKADPGSEETCPFCEDHPGLAIQRFEEDDAYPCEVCWGTALVDLDSLLEHIQ